MKYTQFILIFCYVLSQAGCAVQYYDEKTRTNHLWGFGHMKMRVPEANEHLQAVAQETEILGLGISKGENKTSLIGGWHEEIQLKVIDEDASVRLEWPEHDLFTVRVGSEPPFLQEQNQMERGE